MLQPELDQIRSSRIAASPELRARVLALAAARPAAAPPRHELPWRRWTLVLAAAGAAVAVTAALAVGLATSGKKSPRAVHGAALPARTVLSTQEQKAAAPPTSTGAFGSVGGSGGVASVPATPGRAQLYDAEVTLKVKDLSTSTKRVLRLTRAFGGYVRSVDYGSGREQGSAYLVLRVPIGSVQEAIVRFSALGTILDQHVSIRDVQPQLDRRFRQMQAERDRIAKLQAQLESPALSPDERKALENQLVAARRQLLVLQRQQAALRRQASFATVSVGLRTKSAVVVPVDHPGRIERALDRSGSILLDEVKVAIYVLIVGAPLLLLAGLALAAARLRRRSRERRLLATP